MKRILCGIRPTGQLHLGHYFSIIKPAIKYNADVLIATFHAPFEKSDVASELIKFGIRKEKIIFQEMVFNPELYFRLLAFSSSGELNRMTQYKSSNKRTGHLFIYPVLMAHDINNYDEIIVGNDQSQHLEFAKRLLKKADLAFPQSKVIGGRIMSLTNSIKKMSKSESRGCLFLSDDENTIRAKVRKATTDSKGIDNLHFLYKEFVGDIPSKSNELMKSQLAEGLIDKFFK